MTGFDVRKLTMCEDRCAEDDVDDALQMLVYPLHSPTVSVALLQSATTSPVTVTLSRRLVIRDDPVPPIFLFQFQTVPVFQLPRRLSFSYIIR